MSLWMATVVMPPVIAFVAFLVLGALYTLPHVYRWLGGTKLQPKSPPFGSSLRRGLAYSTFNSAAALGLSLATWPLYRTRIHFGELPAWWVIALQLMLFLVVDDALFYFCHRALHTKFLYRHVHSWHHRVHAPFALLGSIMHPVEYLLISGMLVIVPLAVGMHVYVFWLCVVLRQWGNAELHAGIEGPWSLMSRLPGAGGVRHHDLHHQKVRGNYASLFSHLDRWLGTELT